MSNLTDLTLGSTLTLSDGVALTATAAELNKLSDMDTAQLLVADGAITVKNGV